MGSSGIVGDCSSLEGLASAFGGSSWVSMALVVDPLLGEKALSARDWLSHTSASQEQLLPVESMRKSPSRGKTGALSQNKEDDSTLQPRGTNLAQEGSVDVDCHLLDTPTNNGTGTREEGETPSLMKRGEGSPPVKSTSSPLVTSKSLKISSSEKREKGVLSLTSTSSPLPRSKGFKSSSDETREDGIPLLTSTCSPLIKSKNSKSSSSQGSQPGLVVAPDGVTLVRDRRKCKPRGILTVGLEMGSFDSDGKDEEVLLPMPSPSVATVKWVEESWTDTLSPGLSDTDELNPSCSSVNSKSERSHQIGSPVNSTNELGKEASPSLRGLVEFRPKFAPSVQESYDVRESVEGSPADMIFAHEDISCQAEVVQRLSFVDRDSPVPGSPGKQQHHLESRKVISSLERMAFSGLDRHVSESQSLDIRLSLDLERQADFSGSQDLEEGSDRPCEYSSDVIPPNHCETLSAAVENDGINLSAENESREAEFLRQLPACPTLLEDCDFSQEQSLSMSPRVVNFHRNPEKLWREMDAVSPSFVSPTPVKTSPESKGIGSEGTGSEGTGSEGAGSEVIPSNFTDLGNVRDLHIIQLTHGEGSEVHEEGFSQRLHPADNQLSAQVLVAETLYQLAAENLRKTRTAAEMLNSPGEMSSRLEAVSSLSIVELPVSKSETSSRDGHAAGTGAASFALSSRVSLQIDPVRESDFSQGIESIQTLNQGRLVEEPESEVRALAAPIRGVNVEALCTDESSLVSSVGVQRQFKEGRSGCNKSSFRRAQRHRFSLCSKQVGVGSFLAAAAAFGFVVVSLAMGSCHHCYTRDYNQYYLRPT